MKKVVAGLMTLLAGSLICSQSVLACTDFKLTSKDGTLLISRSMEFGTDLKSNVRTSNRGRIYNTTGPDGKPGMTWKAKYGSLYVDALNQDVAVDGMNEAGLSFEALYLPGETQYQVAPPGAEKQALPYYLFGNWVLSNFASVDDLRNALSTLYVINQPLPGMGTIVFPLHFSVYDATGKGIVIEFVQGKMNIYNNELGMMTNSPTYDWQVANQRNYLNLTPYNPNPITVNGLTFAVTGQGAGMFGLPGDPTPPSRFVKVAFMQKSVYPAENAMELVNLAQHILNNVDIPAGMVRAVSNGKESSDITQWAVFKDLTHKIFYFRTYNDMTIRSIDMNKISLSENSTPMLIPMTTTPYAVDLTERFVASGRR